MENAINRVLVLGGGQLGLMMAEAGARLGLVVDRYDPERAVLLPGTSDLPVPITWEECLQRYPVITVEREAFPDTGLSARLADSERCVARGALAVIPDRFDQKSMLDRLGIASAPWRTLERAEDLSAAMAEFSGVVVKARSGGYDGRGTWIVGDGGRLAWPACVPGPGPPAPWPPWPLPFAPAPTPPLPWRARTCSPSRPR